MLCKLVGLKVVCPRGFVVNLDGHELLLRFIFSSDVGLVWHLPGAVERHRGSIHSFNR